MRCSVDGPADVQETVRVEDVEVAIELKAAPSQNEDEAHKFAADVVKFAKIQRTYPSVRCFAAVIDKSISLPCASSDGMRITDWLAMVGDNLQRHDTRPIGACVEVWYLDPREGVPSQTFFASPLLTR